MATQWHYSRGDQKYGPVSAAEIKTLAKSGELSPTDMLWKEGMSEWKQAGSLKGLFVSTNDAPAPMKEPPPLPLASSVTNAPLVNNSEGGNTSSFHAVGKYCKGIWDSLARNLRVGAYSYLPSDGKWKSQDGLGEPFEISGKSIIRGNLLVGTIAVGKDKRLEISSDGKVIEAWKLVKVQPTVLVFQDAAGVVNTYKLDLWGTNPLAAFFKISRIEHLQGSWQPITKENEWMQFTKDGAVVFSNGSAGRFTVIGVEPNEVIELEMVKGESRQFRIVSLTSSQLVISEGEEAKTFCRPENASANTAKSVETSPNAATKATESKSVVAPSATNTKGFLGRLFDRLTKNKCPECGQYSAELIGERVIGSTVNKQNVYGESKDVTVTSYTSDFRCKNCNNLWSEGERETKTALCSCPACGNSNAFELATFSPNNGQGFKCPTCRENFCTIAQRRSGLISRAETYQSIINQEMLRGNHAAAQVWQLKLNDIRRRLDDLYD